MLDATLQELETYLNDLATRLPAAVQSEASDLANYANYLRNPSY